MIKYYYFVSFICQNEKGDAFGNMTFDTTEKFKTHEDIELIKKEIEEKKQCNRSYSFKYCFT
jgi:hypothetical protein